MLLHYALVSLKSFFFLWSSVVHVCVGGVYLRECERDTKKNEII